MRKELKYSLRPLSYLILIKSNVNCLFRLKLGQNDKQFNGLEKDKYIFFKFFLLGEIYQSFKILAYGHASNVSIGVLC